MRVENELMEMEVKQNSEILKSTLLASPYVLPHEAPLIPQITAALNTGSMELEFNPQRDQMNNYAASEQTMHTFL